MAQGGLVAGGSPPPGVGCVGVGGQEVVPTEEEESATFRLLPLALSPTFLPRNKRTCNVRFGFEKTQTATKNLVDS